jgi:hypothetical protein
MTVLNDTFGAYGVHLVMADPGSGEAWDVSIWIASSTALGGVAEGILGTASEAGEITIVQGWNWYTAADASAVGQDQYDFQTVATHELGHALGLGHSYYTNSVMYATLTTGAARRTLAAADLAVQEEHEDEEGGVAALHAGGMLPAANGAAPADVGARPDRGGPDGWRESRADGHGHAGPVGGSSQAPVLPGHPDSIPVVGTSGKLASVAPVGPFGTENLAFSTGARAWGHGAARDAIWSAVASASEARAAASWIPRTESTSALGCGPGRWSESVLAQTLAAELLAWQSQRPTSPQGLASDGQQGEHNPLSSGDSEAQEWLLPVEGLDTADDGAVPEAPLGDQVSDALFLDVSWLDALSNGGSSSADAGDTRSVRGLAGARGLLAAGLGACCGMPLSRTEERKRTLARPAGRGGEQ